WRAPNRSQRRLIINLIAKPGYQPAPEEAGELTIDATQAPQVSWLQRLREALGIPSREHRVSRRPGLGLGVRSLAALGAMAYAGTLFLSRPGSISFRPAVHQPTPTPLPGAERVRWSYVLAKDDTAGFYPTGVALAGDTLICTLLHLTVALNSADGSTRWRSRTGASIADTPAATTADTVYLTHLEFGAEPGDTTASEDDVYLVAL